MHKISGRQHTACHVDAAGTAIGAAVHQIVHECLQPLGLYSKSGHELLAMHNGVKCFRHLLSSRRFTYNIPILYTDQKPRILTFAFYQNPKSLNSSSEILGFDWAILVHIRYVKGSENMIADFLSRINHQSNRTEIEEVNVIEYDKVAVLPADLDFDINQRSSVNLKSHGLLHPGIQATTKLLTDRSVWPSMKRDC